MHRDRMGLPVVRTATAAFDHFATSATAMASHLESTPTATTFGCFGCAALGCFGFTTATLGNLRFTSATFGNLGFAATAATPAEFHLRLATTALVKSGETTLHTAVATPHPAFTTAATAFHVTFFVDITEFNGWAVVEQDVLPGMGTPKESARHNRDYLRSIGV